MPSRFSRRCLICYLLFIPVFGQNLALSANVLTPSLGIKQTFISNKTATVDESGAITGISPGVSYRAQGPGADIAVNYALNALYYDNLARSDRADHSLSLRSGFDHVEGRWNSYLAAKVSQANISLDGIQVLNPDIRSDNTRELRTIGLGTAFNGKLGNSISYNADINADYADYEDSEDTNGAGTFLRLRSRHPQEKLNWNMSLATRLEYAADGDEQIDTVTVGLDYRFSRRYSTFLTASKSDTDSGRDFLSDASTLAGVHWTPDINSSVRIAAGKRGDNNSFSLDSRIKSRSVTFSANYDETITTTRLLVIDQTVDPQLMTPTSLVLAITPLLVKTGRIAVAASGRRSALTLALFEQSRERSIVASDKETIRGVGLTFKRTLSALSSLTATFSRQVSETRQNNEIGDFIIFYSRQLYKDADGRIELRRTEQTSSFVLNEYEQELLSFRLNVNF